MVQVEPHAHFSIAFAFSSGSAGGAERRYLAIASSLNKLGHTAIVMVEEDSADLLTERLGYRSDLVLPVRYPWWVGIFRRGAQAFPRLHRLTGMTRMLAFTGKGFWRRVRRENSIDIFHLSMSGYLPSMVGDPHLFEVTSPDWSKRIGDNPKILARTNRVIAVSDGVARRVGVNEDIPPIHVMKTMFPVVSAHDVDPPIMSEKEPVIVFAHRFIARKNPRATAMAANQFLREFPEWRFRFLGTGPEEDAIRDCLANFVKSGHVEIGYRTNLSQDLAESRIFISVVEEDNYPSQSVAEAMAHGNALLLSNRGDSQSAFMESNGILVEPDDMGILQGLRFLVADEDRLARMGRSSYEHARQRLDRSLYLEELLEVYASTIRRHQELGSR